MCSRPLHGESRLPIVNLGTFTLQLTIAPAGITGRTRHPTPRLESMPALPILIVDDDEAMREMLTAALRSAGHLTIGCGSAEEAQAVIASAELSLILLDNQLPKLTGSELLELLRADNATVRLPVILIAAAGQIDRRVAGLRAGADDYLVKPFSVTELLARVDAHLRRADAWNAAIETREERRRDRIRALCAIDRTDPRQMADDLCRIIAADHASVALFAFVGADEAVLLGSSAEPAAPTVLSPARGADLHQRARRGPWLELLSGEGRGMFGSGRGSLAYAPLHFRSEVIGLLALGAGESAPGGGPAAAGMLSEAIDYAAIAANLFGPELPANTDHAARQVLIEEIIAGRLFHPVFQEIIDLKTGHPVGFEALTRFDNGVSPDLVFAEAAAVGLGVELELATIASILGATQGLPTDVWVSLNVSPTTICEVRLAAAVDSSNRAIVLELTEHDRIDDYLVVRTAVENMRPEVRLSIDDAGAGFASLQHVLQLEPDFIKLDQSWIRGIDTDVARQALVAGLGHFSDRVGCALIAEGIETEAELTTLRQLAAPLGQGFYFGYPARLTQQGSS